MLHGGARQRPDAHHAALALDRSGKARLASAVDGIDLPIANAAAARDNPGSVLDGSLAGETTPAAVATASFSVGLPAVRLKTAAQEKSRQRNVVSSARCGWRSRRWRLTHRL
jgi:hypothetical protein